MPLRTEMQKKSKDYKDSPKKILFVNQKIVWTIDLQTKKKLYRKVL